MTVNTLATQLMTELGEDTGNATLVTQYERWIQDRFDELVRTLNWNFTRTSEQIPTVASTVTYNLSEDAGMITSARLSPNDDPLEYRSLEDLNRQRFDIEQTGKPRYWYYDSWNQVARKWTIGVWPVPDAVYNMEFEYFTQPLTLSTTSEIPAPRDFLGVLKDGVRALAHENEAQFENADRAQRRFETGVQFLHRKYKHQPNLYLRFRVRDISRLQGMSDVRLPPDTFSN